MQTNRRTWQSFDEMHAAAQQGEAAAQCYLGICYQTGQGVAQDYVEALRWYRRAAEQGNTGAAEAVKRLTGQAVTVKK